MNLAGKTLFITGGSRGIGREIALRCARDGARIVIAAKTVDPHPTLAGTIHSVADEIRAAGGEALPLQVDVRDEASVRAAVAQAVATFGGIDILLNNASAISLSKTDDTSMKRYDLMQTVNARAAFLCAQVCHPHLKLAANPHILTLSPPLNLNPRWFKDHLAYTMSKYGMSMVTLGLAAEWADDGIAVNSLWPATTIATAAIEVHFPPEILARSRHAAIVADAAYALFKRPARQTTGNFFIDEDVLWAEGVTDFSPYAVDPTAKPIKDLFLE